MKLSRYLFKTVKEIPNDAELFSHQFLIRGGYIRQVASGIFSYMPIAIRSMKKIEEIIRQEMDAIGGNEVSLPVTMPASLWSETGRYESVGSEMLRFEDRVGRNMVLGMTHEEPATDLIRGAVNSYKQLPLMIYQLQTKFRDEARPRGGLIRVREFIMKDAYSFHMSQEDLDAYYEECYTAYENIYRRCGLPVLSVKSDTGMMGGSGADEFMAITAKGEDSLLVCSSCDYRANREVAATKRTYDSSAAQPVKEVATPGVTSIQEVADFLGLAPSQTVKALMFTDDQNRLLACFIRGDLDFNEAKLKRLVGSDYVQMADENLLKSKGLTPGFIGPAGLSIKDMVVVYDESVTSSTNLCGGGNSVDMHIVNLCYGRDFEGGIVGDFADVVEGDACPECGSPLEIKRGIEVGNIFKLGTKYSASMGAQVLDENGKSVDLIMGCYGIGVGRLLASVLEVHEGDASSFSWPVTIAPYPVELIGMALEKSEEARNVAETLYTELSVAGIDVLFDDRKASPGVKFKDAELIASPIRLVIGQKSLEAGGIEVQVSGQERKTIPVEGATSSVLEIVEALKTALG